MKNQKGGVKKKNRDKPTTDILHDTLESAGVVLNVISDSSLKCFVIEIIINDTNACEYIDIQNGGIFNKPVKRLVMKIIITTQAAAATKLLPYIVNPTNPNPVSYSKETETIPGILTEAHVQQTAWIRSVANGRVPVCPSVADLIFFDNQDGKKFITYLQTKFAQGSQGMTIFKYILERLDPEPERGICVMIMPEVSASPQVLSAEVASAVAAAPQQASMTLIDFLRLPPNSNFQGLNVNTDLRNRAFSLITACVMRLFWTGILHFDLHYKNFLLYVDENGTLQGKIIDLGNSIIFTEGPNKFMPDPRDIRTLIDALETYKRSISSRDGINNNYKKGFVVGLLDMIKQFDTKVNQTVYTHIPRFQLPDNNQNCQMTWWQTIKDKKAADDAGTDHSFSRIISDAYDIAQNGFIVDIDARGGVSGETIARYVSQGLIPDFDPIKSPVLRHWQWGPPVAARVLDPFANLNAGNPYAGNPYAGSATAPLPSATLPLPSPQGQGNPFGQGPAGQGQGYNPFGQGPQGGARKKTSKKQKFRKNKTKKFALRKSKSKRYIRKSKK
jgi:hypothetical protein